MKVIKPLIEEISQSEVVKINLPICHRDIYLVESSITNTNSDLYIKYSFILGSITKFDKVNGMVYVTTDLTQITDKSDLRYRCPKTIGHQERITIRFIDSIKNISKFYQIFNNLGIHSISRSEILKEIKNSIINTNDIEFIIDGGDSITSNIWDFLKDVEEKIYRLIIEDDGSEFIKKKLQESMKYYGYLKDELIITAPLSVFELFRDMNKNNSVLFESLNQILS